MGSQKELSPIIKPWGMMFNASKLQNGISSTWTLWQSLQESKADINLQYMNGFINFCYGCVLSNLAPKYYLCIVSRWQRHNAGMPKIAHLSENVYHANVIKYGAATCCYQMGRVLHHGWTSTQTSLWNSRTTSSGRVKFLATRKWIGEVLIAPTRWSSRWKSTQYQHLKLKNNNFRSIKGLYWTKELVVGKSKI